MNTPSTMIVPCNSQIETVRAEPQTVRPGPVEGLFRAPSPPLAALLNCFTLATKAPDHFLGQSLDLGYRNLFGGHILGQALVAAGNTCSQRQAHSLHAYFLRGGDARVPIDYHVDRIRDGKSFSVRRVTASQGGSTILILSSSFQVDEPGFEHQTPMPDVPPPESLLPERDGTLAADEPVTLGNEGQRMTNRAIEIRPVDPVDHYHPAIQEPVQNFWFRATGPVPDDPTLHRCLLTYASDFSFMSTCMRPHGVTYFQPDMATASLDHAMWFYHDCRVDNWLLYICESPVAGHARGLNRGHIYSRDGLLVASVAQEGLIRKIRRGKVG
ncbi:MAG: acyl-CoA thioesterase II [Rhodoferax sp.]|nr:acyl-CoA thioesterase II [Rhodoferax sp.]